jgi:cytochrome c6
MVLRLIYICLIGCLIGCTTNTQKAPVQSLGVIPVDGARLYLNNCASCHGVDGNLGMSGAQDLSKTMMNDKQVAQIITYGQGTMPAFKELLGGENEISAVVKHVRTLKKNK